MDDMTPTDKLRALLDERGVEWKDDSPVPSMKPWKTSFTSFTGEEVTLGCYDEPKWIMGTMVFHTPEQAIAATVGKGKAKSHPWGYEADTGFFDTTHCECGELNDISAKFCNQCGREIELDMSAIEYAEDWYVPQHTCKVNADGTLTSLRDGKTYVDAATVGEEHEMRICKRCGVAYELNIIDKGFGKPRFCPNCGYREMYQ